MQGFGVEENGVAEGEGGGAVRILEALWGWVRAGWIVRSGQGEGGGGGGLEGALGSVEEGWGARGLGWAGEKRLGSAPADLRMLVTPGRCGRPAKSRSKRPSGDKEDLVWHTAL